MRLLIIMAVAVCALCVRFNQCIQLMRPGSDGMPVFTQPAITPAELKAAHAARLEAIRKEGLPHVSEKQLIALTYDAMELEADAAEFD